MMDVQMKEPESVVELNDDEISMVSGGAETYWFSEIRIEGGVEVPVWVEFEKVGVRYEYTGNWKYMNQEEIDKIQGGGAGGQS